MKTLTPTRTMTCLLLAVLASLASQSSFGTLLTIVNPSFENPVLNNGGYTSDIPGWQQVGGAGVFWPDSGLFTGSVTDGNQIGYINNGSIWQTLTSTLQPNTIYTLSFNVGWRIDDPLSPIYAANLLAGGTTLASVVTPVTPQQGSWETVTATYTTGGTVIPGYLEIQLANQGIDQFDFDNVSLDAKV